jgi:DNA-binding response OmpR family regulator
MQRAGTRTAGLSGSHDVVEGAHILVIDDDPDLRVAVAGVLADEGFDVDMAVDGQLGLEQAARHPPDLVVLDLMLPDLDAYIVAAGLRAGQGETVPILAITADGRAGEKAARVGAYAYLHKPFDLDELLLAVRRGLRRADR